MFGRYLLIKQRTRLSATTGMVQTVLRTKMADAGPVLEN